MPTIHYKFSDVHTEEIEVTDEVAAVFELLEKYKKKSNVRKHDGTFR